MHSSSWSLLGAVDLSGLKVLRSIQFKGWVPGHSLFIDQVVTIKSPVFSELVIVIEGRSVSSLVSRLGAFEVLRGMHKFRPFKLVFLLDTLDSHVGAPVELARTLETVAVRHFFGFLDSPPAVRIAHDRYSNWDFLDFD